MSPQRDQRESFEDGAGDEPEPVFVTDQKGIVIVWPDRRVHRFSWSVLRQLSVSRVFLAPSGEQGTEP